MLRSIASLTAALALAAPVALSNFSAAPATQETKASLAVGDPAPALQIDKWIKGSPVASFQPGHVYVVEFWATWCGPCIASMPHISALQKDYQNKVTIIGTNIWEDKEYGDGTLGKVESFVAAQGDRMGYTVAYDGPDKATDKAYMAAAGRRGIPSAFIVDGTGKIAWMGHPAYMDFALHEIVAGKWDITTGPEREKEVLAKLKSISSKLREDGAAAQAEFDKFAAEYPYLAKHQDDLKLELLKATGKWAEAYEILATRVDEAIKSKSSGQLNAIAWSIVDPDAKIEKRDLALALRAAEAADKFAESKNAAILDTLARVHFWKGDLAKAIEVQTTAVDVADERMRPDLQKTLDEYKAKAAL